MDAAGCQGDLVYVNNDRNNNPRIDIYEQTLNGKACGTITGFQWAGASFVDARRNVWVTDYGAGKVFEFAPGGSKPILTLNDPPAKPVDVTVDNRNGTVYVTNAFDGRTGEIGVVEVYPRGSSNPTSSIIDPNKGTSKNRSIAL
jgi:hypothetical protein